MKLAKIGQIFGRFKNRISANVRLRTQLCSLGPDFVQSSKHRAIVSGTQMKIYLS